MPEGELALAQAVVYLRVAPKSNAVYTAYGDVFARRGTHRAEPVPLHLRNAPTGLMKAFGYGKGYSMRTTWKTKSPTCSACRTICAGRHYYHPTQEGRGKALGAADGRDQTAALPEGCLPPSENRIRRLGRRI